MPPRLSLNRLCHSCQSLLISPSVFLPRRPTPWLALLSHHQTSQQSRYASILASISDTPGAYSKKIRRGRGPSSGKGKTSGRGHKGQKQHGKVPAHFNGGQTPLEVVKGKRGFKNVFALDMAVVNLDRIQAWIDVGRLDPCRVITVRELCQSRCLHRVKDGVKVLARGKERLKSAINIIVSQASAEAIAAIEAAGGTIQTRFYNKFAIRRIKAGLMDPIYSRLSPPLPVDAKAEPRPKYPYRLPDPASRKELEYYRDPAHRGYLSYMLEDGQGPSLFWKTPGFGAVKRDDSAKLEKRKAVTENRIW